MICHGQQLSRKGIGSSISSGHQHCQTTATSWKLNLNIFEQWPFRLSSVHQCVDVCTGQVCVKERKTYSHEIYFFYANFACRNEKRASVCEEWSLQ